MKIIAVIPARGGSKGIPRKNLVSFLGKPLINWSIEAGLESKQITDVVVTSDDDEILKNSSKFKDVITIKRPDDLALDDSPTEPVLLHCLLELKKIDKEYDFLVLLQPTSPLRNSSDIDDSLKLLLKSGETSLISVYEPNDHPLKSFTVNEKGYLSGLVNNEFPFMPRQSLPKVYQSNGAIYIIKISDFLDKKKLFTNKSIPFCMSSEKSLDIDTLDDLKKINSID